MAALPYAELISALDELPAFAIVNAENAPLEFEDEETGRKVSLFFVDVATAQAQCARFAAQFPSLGLRLMPVGLGMALQRSRERGDRLVPSEADVAAALQLEGGGAIDWDAGDLPLFGCYQMRLPRRGGGGEPAKPLFLCHADAKAALAAADPSGALELVATSLQRMADLMVDGQLDDPRGMLFLPPRASVQYCSERAAAGADGAAALRESGAAVRAAASVWDGERTGSAGLFPD